MDAFYETFLPKGFHNVNAYIFANDPQNLIDFLSNAFHAREINRTTNPENGDIANSILEMGNSCIMISQARGKYVATYSTFYLFVANVDEAYKLAIKSGGTSELEPMDMDYEDRQGGVKDPEGNIWWISSRLTKSDYQD